MNDYSFLDQEEFKSKFATGVEFNSIRFYISGVRCAKCVRKIEDLALTLPGLNRIRVDLGKNLADVELDPRRLSFAQVAERISQLGYQLIPLENGDVTERLQRNEDKRDLIRLAVAGFCAGNIMTFAFATYFGASDWEVSFRWLAFALYLPVVSYAAYPFYRGAWLSLKQKQISIDLPMAVASLSGFVFSTIELWRGHADIYYDSLSGFLFLILLSRFAQKRLQRRFLRPQELHESLQLQKVRRGEGSAWKWARVDTLVPGDRISLYAHETLPADSQLLSPKAYFSQAWLTGEVKSKTYLRGAEIPAGSRLLAGAVDLRVKKPLGETDFGKILEEVRRFSLSKNRMVIQSDRWAQALLATVFVAAIAFLISYWHVSPEQAVQRSLALIILACPCAMAFGTPLALAASLRRAQKAGLIIRDANVFENARTVKTIFFDKTGTLTDTELRLQERVDGIPQVYQKIVLALENASLHPIAFAFRNAFTSPDQIPPVEHFIETPGSGVSGFVFGKFYELKKNSSHKNEISCSLFEDDVAVLKFHFSAQAKPDAAKTLEALRQAGYDVKLLSGDHAASVQSFANELGFSSESIFAGLKPEEKAEIVAKTPHAMMVGDGINDSLAMMRASVGLAVSGGMETALRSAGVFLAEEGIAGVDEFLKASRFAAAMVRRNLTVSATYNLIGGTLALCGYVNPLIAALLMPVSSGFILLSTWWGSRM